MNRNDLALALLVVTIWGANFTVIRFGLDGVPPMMLAALRFVLAALPAIFFVRRPAIHVRYWIGYGLTVGVGQFGCLFYAMHIGMPAGAASVVLQSQAFFTLIFSAILLKESITGTQLLGLSIAAVGLYFVGHSSSASVVVIPYPALLFTLAGAASWGLSNIIVRKASASAASKGIKLDMFSLVVWSSIVPPLPLIAFAFFLNSPRELFEVITTINTRSVFSIIYLAFGATLIGYGLWSKLLAKYQAGQVAPLSLFVPVTGLLTAQIVLGEHLSVSQWIGGFGVMTGLIITTFGFPSIRFALLKQKK